MTDLEFIASITTTDEESQPEDATVLYQVIKNYEQMTVEEVIAEILDPTISESDPLYTQDEKDLANKINQWQNRAKDSEKSYLLEKFEIMYRKPNKEISLPIDLKSPIRNYSDVIQEKVLPAQFGEKEIKYLGADFIARFVSGY